MQVGSHASLRKPFTAMKMPRRATRTPRPVRVLNSRDPEPGCQGSEQAPQAAVLAAFLALSSAAVGCTPEVSAKTVEGPPQLTEYDALQKIVSDRAGARSLLDSFSKSSAATLAAVTAQTPKLPNAPALQAPKLAEPASSLPNGGAGSPPLAALGGAAAALGLGGFALFASKKDGKGAVKRAAPRAQAGTKRVGVAAKQAAKKAPAPVKSFLGGAKAQAKQPARKAGGLFKSAKQPVKQAAKKAAPVATKKLRVGSQRVGTRAAAARAGRRAQLDEDTLTTIGATGVVGLGVLVSAFLVLNVLTGVEAPEVAADVQQAVKNLPGVPNPLPSKAVGQGPQPPSLQTPREAPAVVPPGAPETPRGPELSPPQTPKPESGMPLAPPPSEGSRPKAPSRPDLLMEPPDKRPRVVNVGLEAVKEAPKEVARLAQQPAPEVSQKVEDAAPAVAKKVEAATPTAPAGDAEKKGVFGGLLALAPSPSEAAEEVAKEAPSPPAVSEVAKKAEEVIPKVTEAVPTPQVTELPKTSAAFEEATKKLGSGPSAAEQFRAAVSEPVEKKKSPLSKALGSTAKAPTSSPAASQTTTSPNTLIASGLAVAAVVAVAVAPKDGQKTAGSAPSGGGGDGGSSGDVKEDIAERKKEVQTWISEWREQTGGK